MASGTCIYFVVLPEARNVKSRHWQSLFLLEVQRKILFCAPIGIRCLTTTVAFSGSWIHHSSFYSLPHTVFSLCFSVSLVS